MRKWIIFAGLLSVVGPIAVTLPVRVAAQGGSPFASQDPLAQRLQQENVSVQQALRGQVSKSELEALTQNRPADRPVKIAVVQSLPASGARYGSRGQYTDALHNYLNLGRGLLIVVTPKGPSLAAGGLSPQQLTNILQAHTAELQNDLVSGIRGVIADYDAAQNGGDGANGSGGGFAGNVPNNGGGGEPQRDSGGGAGWLIPVGVIGGAGALVWAGSRASKRKKAMQSAMQPVEHLRAEVVTGISYADNYLDLLPASPDATMARDARQRAAAMLEQAKGVAQAAKTPEDYGRAEAVLEQARQEMQTCRSAIDRATGGTGLAVAVDNTHYKATPGWAAANGIPAAQAAPIINVNPDSIPENERGVCFFCSRPSRISDLTPVTVTMNGQRRKVLACADDVRIIQRGTTPEVRAVEDNGQRVPWYRSNRYDPYRDYTHTEVVFMPGYGVPYGSYDYGASYFDGFMLGAMLSQPYPVPYPMFVGPQGYVTNDPVAAAPPVGSYDYGGASVNFNTGNNSYAPDSGSGTDSGYGSDMSAYASTDFFGASGSDFASSNTDNNDAGGFVSTGFDSSDTSSSSDFGGSDWSSSSSDFSSSDSSSSFDSGSSDSGGSSDFGGGGGDY